jgi:glycosyltransferase involved in cell wall biosynthesis
MAFNYPLLSIIVPVYNSELFIKETIDKIYLQNYPEIELIIIDDGSVDNTAEIIKKNYPEAIYYFQENQGHASAKNKGLTMCNGEFIIFLDSDDYWEENSLYILSEFLLKNTETQIVEGKIREFITQNNQIQFITEGCYMSSFGTCMFRKEVFDIVGLFNERLICATDIDWFIRAWENNIEKSRVDHVILNYRKHANSLTAINIDKQQYYILLMYKFKMEREKHLIKNQKGLLKDYIGNKLL